MYWKLNIYVMFSNLDSVHENFDWWMKPPTIWDFIKSCRNTMHPYSYWGHFWMWSILDDSSKSSLMILKSGYDIDEKGFAWQYWNVFLSPLPIKTKAQALFGSIQVLYHCFSLYPPRPGLFWCIHIVHFLFD